MQTRKNIIHLVILFLFIYLIINILYILLSVQADLFNMHIKAIFINIIRENHLTYLWTK